MNIDEINRRNISLIEKSMLVVCLDTEPVGSFYNNKYDDNDEDDESSSDHGKFGQEEKAEEKNEKAHATRTRDETSMAHQMLHGCGSDSNSGNRWFDKTIQVRV